MSVPKKKPSKVVVALLVVLGLGLLVAVLFLPAGRLDWVEGWAYFGLTLATWAVQFVLLTRRDPELASRRMKVGAGTKRWDRPVLGLMRLGVYGVLVVAGLDAVRYGWAPLPPWLWPLGAALHVAGWALTIWAMLVNTHFEGTVRIQTDRDHKVVSSGPYRVVRHPGYVGFVVMLAGAPLLLGSLWALVPFAVATVAIAVRTALEDRTLRAELEGYAGYAARVRFRLVPFFW